jgi:hypothetical protein
VVSGKKLRANRENAKRSTGPRTIEGKSRASRNAVRHGLFSAALRDARRPDRVAQIANKLCDGDPFPYRYEAALEVAEAQVLLDRIRAARAHMITTTKVRSKGTRQRPLNFRAGLPNLPALDQYEQRAYARRRRALRKFEALRDDG